MDEFEERINATILGITYHPELRAISKEAKNDIGAMVRVLVGGFTKEKNVDGFEKWVSTHSKPTCPMCSVAWVESAKQRDAEIDSLHAIIAQQDEIIENLEMSVRSFTDTNVDIAKQRDALHKLADQHTRETYEERGALAERDKIVGMLLEWSYEYHPNYEVMRGQHARELADRIEKGE